MLNFSKNTIKLIYTIDNKIISIDTVISKDIVISMDDNDSIDTVVSMNTKEAFCCLIEKYKSKFKKSFKEEKHIWEDYRYIHNLKIEDVDTFEECVDKIEKGLESHFDYIYKDAKKVYERRMESFD
jgi:hypothetical protein